MTCLPKWIQKSYLTFITIWWCLIVRTLDVSVKFNTRWLMNNYYIFIGLNERKEKTCQRPPKKRNRLTLLEHKSSDISEHIRKESYFSNYISKKQNYSLTASPMKTNYIQKSQKMSAWHNAHYHRIRFAYY